MRYLVTILGLLLVIGGLGSVKFKQISSLIKMGKEFEKSGPPPESVSSSPAQEQSWEATLSSVGSIAAGKGVSLSNDAPGVVSRIHFESGAFVHEGQVLVELDSSVERAQLASAAARRDLAQVTASRSRALVEKNAIPQSQLDNDDAALKTAGTDLNAIQAQIDRKTVKAPFSGRLGIRAVNLGQYLNPGTTLTVLEAIDSVYVDFTLPQQRLPDLKVGMPVHVSLEEGNKSVKDGAIAAIDPEVDSMTRTVKVRASVPNKQGDLRPGMFAQVQVQLPQKAASVIVPAPAILHAAYGDSVYVVDDKKDANGALVKGADGKNAKVARQQFVKVGESRGDFVAILDGVTSGQEVVTGGAFKLRNGAGIVINNEIKPAAQLDPHPENR
ncbi:MAG TPA: efflux RND transporter periplasmic adaptor subunit [Polyangiaceae bacterium]